MVVLWVLNFKAKLVADLLCLFSADEEKLTVKLALSCGFDTGGGCVVWASVICIRRTQINNYNLQIQEISTS